MLEQLKEELIQLHLELPKNNLVMWTGGNVSARDPETGLVVIKPSGVRYEDIRPEHMVVLDMHGEIVEGTLSHPLTPTATCTSIANVLMWVALCTHTHDMQQPLRRGEIHSLCTYSYGR